MSSGENKQSTAGEVTHLKQTEKNVLTNKYKNISTDQSVNELCKTISAEKTSASVDHTTK